MLNMTQKEKTRKSGFRAYPPLAKLLLILLPVMIIIFITLSITALIPRYQILDYLSEKYNGQEFIISFLRSDYGTLTMFCYPEGGDPVTDRVRAEWTPNYGDSGETYFVDTYFGVIIREDLEADIVDSCSDMNLLMKAYLDSDAICYDSIFDGSKTYADLKQSIIDTGSGHLGIIDLYVLCDEVNKKEEYISEMSDILKKNNFNKSMIYICVTTDADIYESITRENRNDTFRANGETMFVFHIDR